MRCAGLCFLMLGLMLGTARAEAPFANFARTSSISGVSGPGLYRFAVDEQVWRYSRAPGPLDDLRIAGPGEQELPWLLRRTPVELPPQPRAAIVRVRNFADGSSVIALDLGERPAAHDQVRLAAAAGDFVRPVRVDASDDGAHWRPLASGGIVYRLDVSPPPNTQLTVTHPRDEARFVRVTVGPGPTPAIFLGAEATARPMVPPAHPATLLRVVPSQVDPSTRTSRVWLEDDAAPDEAGLPIEAVVFDLPRAAGFSRRAVVSIERAGIRQAVGSGVLYRPRPHAALGGTQESLRIAIVPVRARRFFVEIDDQGEQPLQVARGFGEWRAQELVFRTERSGPHALYVGAAAVGRPSIRLERADAPIAEVQLSKLEINPRFGVVPRRPRPRPPKTHGRWWALVLLLATAGVGAIVWRARRRAKAGGSAKARLA